jgi:hypothetical protein
VFKIGKHKRKRKTTDIEDWDDEEPARKSRGNDSERKIWGFPCAPDIPARMKVLADQLQIPLYALTEHALQLSAGLIARMAEKPEESQLLRQHILDNHVGRRTIEKMSHIDEEMAMILDKEREQRFQIENAVRQIVVKFARRGVEPRDIAWYTGYGLRCFIAVNDGQPVPKDWPPE